MTPERYRIIKELFQAAVECEPGQRDAFLQQACNGDPELRVEVEILLENDEKSTSFLANPLFAETQEGLSSQYAPVSMIGRRIGAYQVVGELGQGGMGAVYLATRADGQFAKKVAVKLIKRGMDSTAILLRFRNEQQFLAALEHPNIARLMDGGTTDDGQHYFIMEYVEGIPIDVYCESHNLSIPERLKLFQAVCSIVQYAHQRHVIHRDLKPGNILVTVEGIPKLVDFGIAKLLNPERGAGDASTLWGLRPMTPEYASPEQVRGEPTTPASDVYSLGVVLYKLLTCDHPYRFETSTPGEIERVVCTEKPEKPSAFVRNRAALKDRENLSRILSGDLDNIVLMALRKEPERRYSFVEALSNDIRNYLEHLPVIARKDTVAYRGSKFVQRNKTAVATTIISFLLVLALAGYMFLLRRPEAIDSIAVLPFVNTNTDPGTDYISDGITESIITKLSAVPDLKVISRASVFQYKGTKIDLDEISKRLGVRAILIGQVLQRGDDLAVSAELVDTRDQTQLLGVRYEQKLSEIVFVQEEIVRQISAKLRLKLTKQTEQLLTRRETQDPQAYQLYLKGRHFLDKRTPEDIQKGFQFFQRAIDADPTYGLAYSGLAHAYEVMGSYQMITPKEGYEKAEAAARKALMLDENLAEVHATLAFVKSDYYCDRKGAEQEFRRAIQLSPNNSVVHYSYSMFLSHMARFDEAIAEINRALELDPLSLLSDAGKGVIFYRARRFDEAIAHLERILKMHPNSPITHLNLGLAYLAKQMHVEAIEHFEEGRRLSPNSGDMFGLLAYAYGAAGKKENANRILVELNEMSKTRPVKPFLFALYHLGQKDNARVVEYLEKSYEARDSLLAILNVDPMFDPLREDVRFRDLMRRLNFPS